MAVTVTDDTTQLHAYDATTNIFVSGVHSTPAADPDSAVQGTACIEARISNGGGVGLIGANHGSTDISDKVIYQWVRQSMIFNTAANGGVRLRISSNTLGTTNYGEWTVAGSDTGPATYKDWRSLAVSVHYPFTAVNGTPPADTAVIATAMSINWLTGNGKSLAIGDQLKVGTKIFVKGGGVGTEGTFAEIAAADETAGRGMLKGSGGVFFVNSGIEFGDTGTQTTRFIGTLQTVVFESFPVSGSLYKISHVGNATGTNQCRFGSSSGTGTAKEGSSGITFKSAGSVPFRIESIDSNVNEASYFGCNLVGPTGVYGDPWRSVFIADASGGPSFVDDTRDCNNATANDCAVFPASPALNDAIYFGQDDWFYLLSVNLGTAKSGTYTTVWEYWNGSAWASLPNVTDGTTGWTTTGTNNVLFSRPDDWAKTTVNGKSRYWVRNRISAFTSSTTVPLITQCVAGVQGDVRLETSTTEMIGCVLTNMGQVRVRNGAFLKKTQIIGSLFTSTGGALDLGSADPATDTVRDLTISNCARGILLRGTSTGATTYNLRNIKFSGNTNDIRVDFPAGATITINVLEGGSDPTIDNVNGSTIIKVVAPVTVKVKAVTETGTPIQSARVFLKATSGGPFPVNASVSITRSGSVATVTHTTHGLATGDWVAILGADQPEYDGPHQITVTGTNTYTYTVSGTPASPATGTITATFLALYGLTDVNGEIQTSRVYSSAQPVVGWARKSTSSPFFKEGILQGTVSSTAGFDTTTTMVSDE